MNLEFKKVLRENSIESKKCLKGIILENALLQAVEKIRMTNSEYNQHFLKDYFEMEMINQR